MEKRLVWGCIADDFTGASDAASFFVKGGAQTILYNGVPKEDLCDGDCQAIVIALKTRTMEASAAREETLQAARWLRQQGAGQLYIKYCSTFDSTPEGNIGPVLDALLEEYQIPYTILCPALPVNGRKVMQGHLYVNGVPLHESPMKNHPLTPMWDSSIAGLMKPQSKYPCMNVTKEQYAMPRERVLTDLRAFGEVFSHFYVVPDYETEEDARAIADIFGSLPLLSGGSGILTELARSACREEVGGNRAGKDGVEQACVGKDSVEQVCAGKDSVGQVCVGLDSAEQVCAGLNSVEQVCVGPNCAGGAGKGEGSAIMLAGSCSEMTRKQIAYAKEHGVAAMKLQPLELLTGEQTLEMLWNFVRDHSGETVLLYSSDAPDQVKQIQETGKLLVAELLEQTIASLAKRAVEAGYTKIIVAGGETSGAVTRALDFDSFIIGESVAPGVPVMIPRKRKSMRLVLKSGNFGQEDFFLEALRLI